MSRLGGLTLMVGLVLSFPGGARAWELGKPYAKIGFDLGFDDRVSGREAPDPIRYSKGNADGNGALSLGGGHELRWSPDRILTVSARLKGYRYLNYPDLSGAWGGLSAELATYRLYGDLDAYWGASLGSNFDSGRSGGMSVAFDHPIASKVTGTASFGAYRYANGLGTDHTGAWGELSATWRLRPFSLSMAYSYTRRGYDLGWIDQVNGISTYVSWRLFEGLYLKASAERIWTGSSDPARIYQGTLANLGSVYYLF